MRHTKAKANKVTKGQRKSSKRASLRSYTYKQDGMTITTTGRRGIKVKIIAE